MLDNFVPIKERRKDKVIILGFAPDSRGDAPLEDESFDIWALNELYLEPDMQQRFLPSRASLWFQLHGYSPPTYRDPNPCQNLRALPCPVVMWAQHPQIPNSVVYPLEEILHYFDIFGEGMAANIPRIEDRAYFTNSISWMIALAIYEGYKEIHVYGVNMAQDQEYAAQRPSCEFFLGWARGKGIKVYLPPQSDLLLSRYLYGYDDGSRWAQKMAVREGELNGRFQQVRQDRINLENQASQARMVENQLLGAVEDNGYMIKLGPNRGKDVEVGIVRGDV